VKATRVRTPGARDSFMIDLAQFILNSNLNLDALAPGVILLPEPIYF